MDELFNLTTLTVFYDYDKGNGSHHSFGSVEGAKSWVKQLIEKDSEKHIDAYSIEEYAYIPCDKNDPSGKLYLGCRHFEFKELKEDINEK